MMNKHISANELEGRIVIPPSKSDGQRAILCAGLGSGTSTLRNVGTSDDETAMLRNILLLGAEIVTEKSGELTIIGTQQLPSNLIIDCGESGLGLRLMTSIVSAFDGKKLLIGHGSILEREHLFFEQTFPRMGVDFSSNSDKIPFQVIGKMKGGSYSVDGSQSSQYISGLLMALPLLKEDSVLKVKNLTSKPYVEMTLQTMESFGILIQHQQLEEFTIFGGHTYISTEYRVESDWSSASYWLAAAAIGHSVKLAGLNFESAQADRGMLTALAAANCSIEIHNGILDVDGSNRKSFQFDATHCPDLFPALVIVAAFCDGLSRIKGVHRLKNKESDR